ncbi:hypothetical protein M3Y95_00854200 [Aphelenchoides besseyi]|nr:hypothetical protein M3Y95_00854200 [Aphelenchoides besseyi]
MAFFLVTFFHWCIYVAEGTSLMLNTIVIYLASTETTKDLKEYKNLLILNGIVDYTCTLIGIWNHENMEITQGVWVHMFGWPANMFPKSWHYLFVGAYSMKLAFGILALPIQFAYRWFLLCKKKKLTVPQLIGLFFFTFIASCHWWFMFGFSFYVSDYKYTDHKFLMSNPFIFNDENPHPTLVIGELNSLPMYELIISTALVGNVLICFMIAYFTYDTIRKLEEMKVHMAPRTRKLQSQMNRTLFAQTASVFATALIPLLVLVFMMLSAIEIHGMGTCVNMILSWIPVLNPLCTIVLVHRFRSRFLSGFLPWFRSSAVSNYESSNHFSKDNTPITIA